GTQGTDPVSCYAKRRLSRQPTRDRLRGDREKLVGGEINRSNNEQSWFQRPIHHVPLRENAPAASWVPTVNRGEPIAPYDRQMIGELPLALTAKAAISVSACRCCQSRFRPHRWPGRVPQPDSDRFCR